MTGILNVLAGDNAPATGGNSAAYTNFVARTSGLNSTHLNAYAALLNGLTTDGFFDGSGNSTLLDGLYMWATADATTALLNLVQNNYNATVATAPTFTADAGYDFTPTGAQLSANFNPATATSPNFVRNSAHIWVWANPANTPSDGGAAGTTTEKVCIYARSGSATNYSLLNNQGYGTFWTNALTTGMFLGTRTGATAELAYTNGSQVASSATGSNAVASENFVFGKTSGTTWHGTQIAGGFGAGLDATHVTNLYTRAHTYLQTIAGIA
jgi:hypothetical protein